MKIEGQHEINGSANEIYTHLMNPEVLARITPGIDRLELVAEDKYDAIAEVRIGPVKGNFAGVVEVKDQVDDTQFTLLIDQKSKIGNAKAEVTIFLEEKEATLTDVRFEGDVRMSGMLATTGQRVIKGVVAMLSRQFFDALAKELAQEDHNA